MHETPFLQEVEASIVTLLTAINLNFLVVNEHLSSHC